MNRDEAFDALREAEQGGPPVIVKVTGPGSLTDPETRTSWIERREGVRGPYPRPTFYRWACRCGQTGRWTRQDDTAAMGRDRHDCPRERCRVCLRFVQVGGSHDCPGVSPL